jgi:hypothetical protein
MAANLSMDSCNPIPRLFGKVAAQSSNVENNVLNAFRNNDLSNLKVYLDFGKYDLPCLFRRSGLKGNTGRTIHPSSLS